MSTYEDDARIVDDATNIRLKELEVEKAKIEARSKAYPKLIEFLQALLIPAACTTAFLDAVWFLWDFRVQEEIEQTKRDLALSPAAQVAREHAALSIEQELSKRKLSADCMSTLRMASSSELSKVSKHLLAIGCKVD